MTQPRVPSRFDDPALFFNRELSMLEFGRRVLEQAKDPQVPLLERLRFLTITSSNLDEFFEIRVAGLKEQADFGLQQVGPDGLSPPEQLRRISEQAHALVEEQYRVLNGVLLPELETQDIRILRRDAWSAAQRGWLEGFFAAEVFPVLTPLGLDPAHPFPRVLNKGLSFVISVDGKDAFGRTSGMAVLQVPRSLPRLIRLPAEVARGEYDFVLLSSIIHAQIGELFPGMKVTGCHQFRVTRNSDLWVDEEEVEDLLQALKGELLSRKYGAAVRLEVADTCDEELAGRMLERLDLEPQDLYRVHGPVNLHRVAAIHGLVDRPDLKYPSFVPRVPRWAERGADLFAVIRERDVLLHHPYESFAPVVGLLQQAAADPNVLAIKQTVYRTDENSPLVEALLEAARAGKEVTAVVELRARFDEARNIALATRLQDAGANVVYGVVGYKTHAKMLLIVRREGKRLRRYVHMGTGNYHPGTARAYTDFGLLTCSTGIGNDVHKVFQQLTGLGKVTRLRSLLHSPFTLHKSLIRSIDAEAAQARAKRPARIVAKMNSLTEPALIQALYRASQAGVQIDLVIRGICRLRPGVAGVSENIRVRSIVGRFLEHSRVFFFHARGKQKVLLSSADWMERNLFRRVETVVPIEDEDLRKRVFEEALQVSLEDSRAWILQSDGSYRRARSSQRAGKRARQAQDVLLERYRGLSAGDELEPRGPQEDRLLVEVGPGEGMVLKPAVRKRELEARAVRAQPKRGQRGAAAGAVEANGEAQENAQAQGELPLVGGDDEEKLAG